jgi:hypothetical protein
MRSRAPGQGTHTPSRLMLRHRDEIKLPQASSKHCDKRHRHRANEDTQVQSQKLLVRNQEAIMSLLHKTDVYQGLAEKADRRYPEYGFALALIGVALALVVASVMFPGAFGPTGEFSLFGP